MSDLLEIFAVDEGKSRRFTTVLSDLSGAHPTLLTATMRLYNADLEDSDAGFIINGRNGTNCLNAGDCTYTPATGVFEWNITGADTTIADQAVTTALYIAEVSYTYGSPVKQGGFRIGIRITNWLAGALQLCTVEDVLRHPAMREIRDALTGDPAEREHLANLIALVSGHVANETERELRRKTWTEVVDVEPGDSVVRVRAFPIVSVTSIKQSSSGDFANVTAMDASRWLVLDGGRWGEIGLRSGCFLAGRGTVEVVHKGGLATRVETLPAEVRFPVAEQAALLFKRGKRLDLVSEGQPQGSATFLRSKVYADSFALMLHTLKRPEAV